MYQEYDVMNKYVRNFIIFILYFIYTLLNIELAF